MSINETNMTNLRSNLADALDQVAEGNIVLVKRRGKPDTAIVDSNLLEDFMATTNPRIVNKTLKARSEITKGNTISFDEVYTDIIGI